MYVSDNGNGKWGKFRGGAITVLGEVYTPAGTTITGTDSRDTYLAREMHRIAQAIYNAKQRMDAAEVQRLLAEMRPIVDEYRDRGAIGVNPFDKFLIATDEWVRQTLAAVPGAIAAPLQAVGSGLIQGLIPFAVIAAGVLYFKKELFR